MPAPSPGLLCELFPNSESDDLVFEAIADGDFEGIRPNQARSEIEIAKQLNDFIRDDIAGSHLAWAIREADFGKCIGCLQITLKSSEYLELGYWVAPLRRNLKVAKRAVPLLLDVVCISWPSSTIYANVPANNEASIRVLQKAGFTELTRQEDTAHVQPPGDRVFNFSCKSRRAA